jgi:Protein of unknown function (DUF2612)
MPVDPDLLAYYSNLLIVQYETMPNMVATTKLLVNQSLCDGLPQELQTCFNLSTAVGDQLTILGEIVGVPRNIFGLDLINTFFNYTSYVGEPSAIGFGSYLNSPYSTSLFRSYFDSATYVMTDYQMQQVIYLKILYNNLYSSTANIVNALWELFGNGVIFVDNQNMTVTYYVTPPFQIIFTVAQYLNILLRPMGVGATIVNVNSFVLDNSGNVVYDNSGNPVYQ